MKRRRRNGKKVIEPPFAVEDNASMNLMLTHYLDSVLREIEEEDSLWHRKQKKEKESQPEQTPAQPEIKSQPSQPEPTTSTQETKSQPKRKSTFF